MGSHGSLPRHHRIAVDMIANGAVRARNTSPGYSRSGRSRPPSPSTSRARASRPSSSRGSDLEPQPPPPVVSPSLMCADFLDLGKELRLFEEFEVP